MMHGRVHGKVHSRNNRLLIRGYYILCHGLTGYIFSGTLADIGSLNRKRNWERTTMIFSDRIEQGNAAPYVDLLNPERELYQGAGWFLAAVENGRITSIKAIDEDLTPAEMSQCFKGKIDLSRIGKILLDWVGDREVYLGMMSCYQFCTPERFTADKLPRISRLIVKQVIG